jgi:dTDP-L-rhamnose 4-epimerase
MKQVLVTGGAGFVGSHIVDALVAHGHNVRVIDSLDRGAHASRPDYLNAAADYVWRDLSDAAADPELFTGVDAVCHQAAKVGLGIGWDDAPDYVVANDLATVALLRALASSGFRGRLVLAGSMVVYGEGRYRCRRHGIVTARPRAETDLAAGLFDPCCDTCGEPLQPEAVGEETAPDPRSVYAATKLAQEHLCQIFGRECDVPVTNLRYHNVYGPRMPRNTPYAGVASIFRSALEEGRPPRVFEDGRQLRDFVDVEDVAQANIIALTAPDAAPGTFNIASGTPRTVGDMAECLSTVMGGPPPQVTGEFRAGDVRHVFASTARAEAVMGFKARASFTAGMARFATAPLRAPAS